MKILSVVVFLCVLSGCAFGTGTGNPLSTTAGSGAPDPQAPANTVTADVFATVCQMIEKCHAGVTDAVCGTGIQQLTTFGPKLGMLMNPWPTVEQIAYLDFTHQIHPDPVQGDKCVAQMLKLSCSDPAMQSAYDPNAASPFTNAADILDPVCAGVFGP